MTWNPRKPYTQEAFRRHIQTVASETLKGLHTPAVSGKIYQPGWWINAEIRVFWERTVPRQAVDVIVGAMDERIFDAVGKRFQFCLHGSHASAVGQIDGSTKHGQIDEKKLFATALSEEDCNQRRGGRQHADVYVTAKPFVDDHASWGAASFRHGTSIFALHGDRGSSRDFLRAVALHEANHLLGMYAHCDDYQCVDGHQYDPSCNMHYVCPSGTICPKCKEFLLHWWAQIARESA